MRKNLLNFLFCPNCKSSFKLVSNREESEHVEEGYLICNGCNKKFKIEKGVPRILVDIDSVKHNTAKIFGIKWKQFSTFYKEFEEQFLDWIKPIDKDFFRDKVVLDAGCGIGKHVYFTSKFGAKEVIGIDLSEAVDVAYEYTKDLKNCHIVQADIYNLPFKNEFDFIYSIGVLHHLPKPEDGFKKLLMHLRRNGSMFAWVYGREGNNLLKIVDPIRKNFLSKLPLGLNRNLALLITLFLYPLTKSFYRGLYNLKLLNYSPQGMFFYYLSKLRFTHIQEIVYDQLIAPISNYYYKGEFERWFRNNNLKDVKLRWRNRNSWSGVGIKE